MNMVNTEQTQAGFTLLESIIYIGLFTLIIGGAVISTYYIFDSNSRLQGKVYSQQEGNFVLSKFNWALSGSSTATVQVSPPVLAVTRAGVVYTFSFDAAKKAVTLSRDGGVAEVLNNDAAPVSNFAAARLVTAGEPDKVSMSFNIDNLSFESEKYVRE